MKRVIMGCTELKDGVESEWYTKEYDFLKVDGGRSTSKRSKQIQDCTVRALAIVRDLEYDEAYDILAEAGRKCSRGFHLQKWAKTQPDMEYITYQAVKGEPRMSIHQFVKDYPEGTWILRIAKHVMACIDGVVHDSFESRPDRCVYGAIKITKGDER